MQEKFEKLYSILYTWLLKPAFLPYWIATIAILVCAFFLAKVLFRKQYTFLQALAFAMTFAYGFLVYSYTVLTRPSNLDWLIALTPFWSYRDVIVEHSETELLWILINIAMLAPIGFLLPFWKKHLNWKHVLAIGAASAYFIEFSQLFLHRGDFELFDDPLNNIAGCLIGFAIGRVIQNKIIRSELSDT